MKLMYVNNDGGGFADRIDVPDGMTVETFFQKHCPDRRPEDHLIRVNRRPVSRDQVLQEGDRITITPTKIEGAA